MPDLEFLSSEAEAALLALIDRRIAERLPSQPSRPRWLTVDQAAEYLGTTPAAIYKRIKRDQLPSQRPEGSRILVDRIEIDRLLDPSSGRS